MQRNFLSVVRRLGELLAFYVSDSRRGMEEVRAMQFVGNLFLRPTWDRKFQAGAFCLQLLLEAVVVMLIQEEMCPIGGQGVRKP